MRKNNRAARAARTLVEFSDVGCANDIVKFPNVNLSFLVLNCTAFLLVHNERDWSTKSNANRKQQSQNGHNFANVYFRVMFDVS